MLRLLIFLGIVIGFSASWVMFAQISLIVIGQPSSVGLMQQTKEEPFFLNLAKMTGIPLGVTYIPLDQYGIKDRYQLQTLQEGLFDLVSLRFPENSKAEPTLQGIDLAGLYHDYETARHVIRHYSSTVDRHLNEAFDAKLLGVWTFGPQVFFCRVPIQGIEDLSGLKIRISSSAMAPLIVGLGGIPATISFEQTKNALAIGLVDCAISSAASANFAGWPKYTQYYFPLMVHFGLNGYVISLRKWQKFSPQQQRILTQAFADYLDDLWEFSKAIHQDASQCNIGCTCRHGIPYQLTLVEPSIEDMQALQQITQSIVLPEWSERCEKMRPNCREEWEERVLSQLP